MSSDSTLMCLRTRFLEEQLKLSLLILTISSIKGDLTGDDKISMMSAMSSSTEVELTIRFSRGFWNSGWSWCCSCIVSISILKTT